MDKRKFEIDLSSPTAEPSPKRFKNVPTVCTSEGKAQELLQAKKTFVFDPCITKFTVPEDCYTLEHLKRLTRALQDEGNHLQSFTMACKSDLLTEDRVTSILQFFEKNNTLKSLNLKNIPVNLKALSAILKKKVLNTLIISHSDGEHWSRIADIADDLIACTSLTHLDLSHNRKNSFFGLGKVISQHKQLRTVILSKRNIRSEFSEAICTALKMNNTITHLDLAKTSMSDQNAVSLAQSLHKNAQITYLDISYNAYISTNGTQALVTMLKTNRTITALKMRDISFDKQEVELFKSLEQSNTVKELIVTVETGKGIDQLGIALERWTALTVLSAELTNFTSVASFANGISKNTTLKKIDFRSTEWPEEDEDIEVLDKAFSGNRTIIKIAQKEGDEDLKECFDRVTKRNNSILKFDRAMIKPFVITRDWDGMWKFIQDASAKGLLFEDLINKDHFNLDEYELVLETYLNKSTAHNNALATKKANLEKSIGSHTKRIDELNKKIAEARRIIEESNRDMTTTRTELNTFLSFLDKVKEQQVVESKSRGYAEVEYRIIKEKTKLYANQCKRAIPTWSLDDVVRFLQDLQLHNYVQKFKENLIKGDVLINLTTLDFHQLGLGFKETKSLMSSLFELRYFQSLSEVPEGILYWNNDQVVQWLQTNNFQHVVEPFRNWKITGEDLIVLDNYDLTHWLKIEAIADRTALESAIRRLRAELELLPNNSTAQKKIPKQFLCSITHEIMKDPVSTIDGHTYERSAIESWLKDHNTSPLTNEILSSKQLIPNHQLKSLIAEFLGEAT